MTKVFISYRREDSADATGRIFDRLRGVLGGDSIFMDVDTIPLGVDFRDHLRGAVEKCDVLLAIIGQRWVAVSDEAGRRRLEDSEDFVRIEIESALKRGVTVIPVLIHGSGMPKPDELPESLRELAFRNAAEIRSGGHFHHDVERLITSCKQITEKKTPPPPPSPRKKPASFKQFTGLRGKSTRKTTKASAASKPPAPPGKARPKVPALTRRRRWQLPKGSELLLVVGAAILTVILAIALWWVWTSLHGPTGVDSNHDLFIP